MLDLRFSPDHSWVRRDDDGLATVGISPYAQEQLGDVVFVDSTHVVKTGSDVNHIVFELFPRLAPGVHVHVHDLFPGFEYPRAWVLQGRAWSEAYLLRAFLMFNDAFEVTFWLSLLAARRPDWFAATWPAGMRNPGGSIWLTRRNP